MPAYPIRRCFAIFTNRLHHAPFFVLNIPHPVRFAGCHQDMGRPSMHMTVQPVIFLDFEFRRILDRAAFAVAVAIFAVDGRVDFEEEVSGGGLDGHTLVDVESGKRFGRSSRREKRATAVKSGGQKGSHLG